jgi:hypothetical protein
METVLDFLKKNKPSGFNPQPYYSPEGDSLTFFFENKEYYRERVDDFLTAYRSISDNGLIGCQIKGLPKALELLGNFGISITDGKVLLTMIFMAFMAQTMQKESKECYKELGRMAAESGASIPAKELQAA